MNKSSRRLAGMIASLASMAGLVGLVAVAGGAATASVQTSRVDESSISIRVAHRQIEAGETDRVTGNLHIRGGVDEAGRTVLLEARAQGETGFTQIATVTSGPLGGLKMDVQPAVTTHYRWRFEGAEDARPSRSGIATVRVGTDDHHGHRVRTTLSIRAVHRLAGPDGTDTVRGRLRTHHLGLPNRAVLLLARSADDPEWQTVNAEQTDRTGLVSFDVSPVTVTRYRLVFLGTRLLAPSHSGVVRVGVRPVVTIAADPIRINPGESTAVTGTVTFEGLPLAGATVDLRARSKHSGGFVVVGTATTAVDGTVGFTDAPTENTTYRLVVHHATTQPKAVSESVRVHVRKATALAIVGRDTDDGFVITGVLLGGGRGIPAAPVTLLSQAPGSATWTEVDTKRTKRHGKVRFVQPAAPGTSYQLSFAGDWWFAPSLSGIVVD
jgi:hypothetical protein